MAEKNLLPKFTAWKTNNGGANPDMDSLVFTDDGYGCSFSVTHESTYIYYDVPVDAIKGHTLKLTLETFSATDNLGWLRVRVYNSDQSASTNYGGLTKELTLPYETEIPVPGDCGRFRIYVLHDYEKDGIDPPQTITIAGLSLVDTYTESLTTVNFHKVLDENIPENVIPGTEHIYFSTNGTRAIMHISTMEGKLIPVMGDAYTGEGGVLQKYSNAYTQAWIDERKAEIIALQKLGDCVTFVIATDIHVRIEDGTEGRYNQVRDLLMVTDQIPIDYICCCGDIMSYCQDWDGNVEPRTEAVKNIFNQAKCPWFATKGNHDFNSDDNNPNNENSNIKEFNAETCNDKFVTARDWHKSITSKLPYAPNMYLVFDETHPTYGYFYVDDYQNKHRLIFTNSEETHETELGRPYIGTDGVPDCFISGIETEHQVNFLINKAMDMTGKTDWVVSFYSHTVPYTDRDEPEHHEFHGYGGDSPDLRTIVKAFQEGTRVTLDYGLVDVINHDWKEIPIDKDFSAQGPIKVIGWFGGHCHDDCYKKVDGLNINISTCTCADQRKKWSQDPDTPKLPPERNKTNYAMSLNVFVVNKTTRTVNMIKLGSKRDNTVKTSSDLTFTY